MARRKPIDYTPQFGGGIFRPKDEVEHDLAALDTADAEDTPDKLTSNRSNGRTFERTIVASDDRPKVRHSFDVYKDQITALTAIQARLFSSTGKKPKLGELVQQALDDYIRKHEEHIRDRSNERTDERHSWG